MRVEKNGTRYFSFAELPISNPKTNKTNKISKDTKAKFEKRHTCRVCKQPLTWIDGTNVCVCQNPNCKGWITKTTDDEGNVKKEVKPFFHTLDETGTSIASKIYAK